MVTTGDSNRLTPPSETTASAEATKPDSRAMAAGVDYRSLPSVAELLRLPSVIELRQSLRSDLITTLTQEAIAAERTHLREHGGQADQDRILDHLLTAAAALNEAPAQRVINGSGVILQTNLGRAPVSTATAAAMADAAAHYTPLEFDLSDGRRGDRMALVRRQLARLTGADDALVVNNNAAAVLLMLSALANGREVILSRGEAVEIGGGFRIPDVMAQSGARLIEVGTTNRTYRADYAAAVRAETAALLKVHTSNFRVIGFTHTTTIGELAELARERGLLALEDLGSGALLDTTAYGLAHEPTIGESIAAGADLVAASGDKLLGGPQAGILVGRRAIVEQLRRHPLARALRADKTCLAGLAATLHHYLAGEATEAIPVWQMLALRPATLAARALAWQTALVGLGVTGASTRSDRSTVGGGSLPGETLPTTVLTLPLPSLAGGAVALLRRLRQGQPALIARAADALLLIDPRTVAPEDDDRVPLLLAAAIRSSLAVTAASRAPTTGA